MHDHGACPILQVPNASLCQSSLEVGVDAAKCQLLSLDVTIASESRVGESAVVAVIAFDLDVVAERVEFECMFGGEGLGSAVGLLHVNVGEATEVVDEDGCAGEALVRRLAFALGHKAWSGTFQLVHRHDVARCLGGCQSGIGSFGSSCTLGSFSEKACGADWNRTSQEVLAVAVGATFLDHFADERKGHVPHAMMHFEQLMLGWIK